MTYVLTWLPPWSPRSSCVEGVSLICFWKILLLYFRALSCRIFELGAIVLRASLVRIVPRLGLIHADCPYSSMRVIQRVLCDWCQSGLRVLCVSEYILLRKNIAFCCEYMLHACTER